MTWTSLRSVYVAVHALCLFLSAAPPAAFSQTTDSGTVLYGVLDTSLRFENNSPASRDSSLSMESGGIGGSHIGLRGHEALGRDLYAAFRLEAGITPNTGILADSSRLFSREAWVGLGGAWGQLTAGRHYAFIHDILSMRAYDAFWVSNYPEAGWYSGTQYTLRRDNSLRYLGRLDQVEVGLMYQTNEHGVKNSYSAMAIIPIGGLELALAHESDYSAASGLRASLLVLRYTFNSGTTLHAYTLQSRAQGRHDRRDQLYALGVIHPLTHRTTLFGTAYHNRSQAQGRGTRHTLAARVQYALSKRTSVYVEADYSWVRGITVAEFNDAGKPNPNTRRDTFSVGYRHAF